MADLTERPVKTKSVVARFAETSPLILFFLLAYADSVLVAATPAYQRPESFIVRCCDLKST
jgi:hypothetical protein